MRIVSLIASATEIVCALGFEDQLAGRSHECDFPPSVKRLPQLTSPKFKVEGSSLEIDQRVKSIVEEALSVYRVDEAGKHSPWMTWEELVTKDPDIIFVSPCGFDIQRTLQEMHLLGGKPEWKSLKAVAGGRVVIADGNQYFNRPGPRLAESLEI